MKRIPLQLPEELVARVDEARGDVARNRWIRRAVERALEPETVCACGRNYDHGSTAECRPVPYRQSVPGPNVENVRSSAQAKSGRGPYPKRGKA